MSKTVVYFLAALVVLLLIGAAGWIYLVKGQRPGHPQGLMEVKPTKNIQESYDVIVVGTDPEGVAAAISAARNGLKTLLVDGRNRENLGGLMTLGWLNSLDHNYDYSNKSVLPGQRPALLNKGIFTEWYSKVEGDSFDVHTAANAFYEMVKNEENIDLLLKAKQISPILEQGQNQQALSVTGIRLEKDNGQNLQIKAKAVIDATQDADIAAAAGVPFTIGREDIGNKHARMAVTLVFRLNNVTPEVWKQVQKRLKEDGDPGTDANELSAWGYGEMQKYPAVNKERVRMRGLNIGRQNDNTVLINALQIFGIDGLDPQSRQEAFEIGKNELPHVVNHMKKLYPEFSGAELDGTAPELYVRETRHIYGEYRLTMIDVLENRDQWDRIAFGSYPVDIQRISPTDNGAVMSHPEKYAVPFRSILPLKVDRLLVVGRSASFDTLPHGSARVIPVGMAAAEAAGAAAKLAIDNGITFRQLSASKEYIATLQDMLNKHGMELKPYSVKPAPYMEHKAYEGLKTVVGMGLVIGGYDNSGFALDPPSNVKRMENLVYGVRKIYSDQLPGDPSDAAAGIDAPENTALTFEQAAYMIAKTLGKTVSKEQAAEELQRSGLLKRATIDSIAGKQGLTNGDSYVLIRDLVDGLKVKGKVS